MTTRNWLITGVSSGFGRELATQLLDRGDIVVGRTAPPTCCRSIRARSTASCST
jgi:NAD(P)-dependent dehydrogenase (short-subunit alcohol dehydrogenase family)